MTSEDARTIDIAKTASIDMMALNNKVVNMRQVVKRTKVQVINKLCKNIAALKKKKGTDEQKANNLRKAERFIEEIDSIKHLKEDKVSKYSLANTLTFEDVSKRSTAAGPRALARLADHNLMKKVVTDFREQHPDWRDLAAYLLVKQTGRRFKTKKQKQGKKMSRCVENIHASETMTKAYIQERFGKDGLEKAEQRFERKRKRAPLVKTIESDSKDQGGEEEPEEKKFKEESEADNVERETDELSGLDNNEDKNNGSEISHATADDFSTERISEAETDENDTSDSEESLETSSPLAKSDEIKRESNVESNKGNKRKMNLKKDSSNTKDTKKLSRVKSSQDRINKREPDENVETNANQSENSSSEDEQEDSQHLHPSIQKTAKKSECVVKELDIDKSDISSSDEDDQADSESSDEETVEDLQLDSDGSASGLSKRQEKKAKAKTPSFLTNLSKKPVSDPFFAASDDEVEGEETFNDFDEALRFEPANDMEDEYGSNKHTQSMFYNPHGDGYRQGGRGGQRGCQRGGRWQRQARGRGVSRGSNRGGGGRPWGRDGGKSWNRGSARGQGHGRRPEVAQDSDQSRFGPSAKLRPGKLADTTKAASSEKLHPSWEASKKRRAEQSGIQTFTGSKITFGDDD